MRNQSPPTRQPGSHRVEQTDAAQSRAPNSSRAAWTQIATIFGLALAARLMHFYLMRDTAVYQVFISDAWSYDNWAQQIAGGQWLGTELFYQTPLYPYSIAVLYSIFGHTAWAVRIFQALLGATACAITARSGTRLFGPREGWLSGLMLAFYPPAIFFDGIVQKAAFDLFLMTLLVWVIVQAQPKPKAWHLVLAGVLLAAFALNRENALVLIPLVMAWAVWLAWSDPLWVRAKSAVLVLLGIAALLLPIGFRNWYVGGAFLITTSQLGANFWMGNHLGASGRAEPLLQGRGDPRFEREDARRIAEQALGRELTMPEVSNYWMDLSLSDMRQDPAGWVRLMFWKWFLTWNTEELVDAEGIRGHADSSFVLRWLSWPLSFGVLCPLAAMGLWWTRRDWRQLWLLIALMLAFAAAITIFYVFARYRYPLVPVVVLFAAAGVTGLWDRLRAPQMQSGGRDLAIGVSLAALAGVLSNWPLPAWYRDDEITYFNIGTCLMDEKRDADAVEPLQQAIRIKPDFAAAYNNLGQAMMVLNKPRDAAGYFAKATKVDPKMAAAWFGLSEAAERQGELQQALDHLQQATAVDPKFSGAHRAAGRIELQRGNAAAAIEHLKRVVELNPKVPEVHAELAGALVAAGRLPEAVVKLRAAVKLAPGGSAANDLAWILATATDDSVRNGTEAIVLAETACQATEFRVPQVLDTLAAAQAEAGQFDEAEKTIRRALELAGQKPDATPAQTELVRALNQRLDLYRQRQPYRDPSLKSAAQSPPNAP